MLVAAFVMATVALGLSLGCTIILLLMAWKSSRLMKKMGSQSDWQRK